jgi:putative membrane protein
MTDKFIFRFVAAVSIFVFVVVLVLNRRLIPAPAVIPSFTHYLPKLNALLNGTCSLAAYLSIFYKTGKNNHT